MIIWTGKSLIDGAPIMVIVSAGSQNAKTGDMLQCQILRRDMSPIDARNAGLDRSICGDCKHRHSLGGACYVVLMHEPNNVYKAWQRGTYDKKSHIKRLRKAMKRLPIRIGTYGDPAAVPTKVWTKLIEGNNGARWTGYTHLWKEQRAQRYKSFLMASVDTVEEATQAAAMGWRYFLVSEGKPAIARTVECLYSTKEIQCDDCTMCDGANAKKNVWVQVHGVRAKRFALTVLQGAS